VLTELYNVLAVLMELVKRAQCLKEGHQLFFFSGGSTNPVVAIWILPFSSLSANTGVVILLSVPDDLSLPA